MAGGGPIQDEQGLKRGKKKSPVACTNRLGVLFALCIGRVPQRVLLGMRKYVLFVHRAAHRVLPKHDKAAQGTKY